MQEIIDEKRKELKKIGVVNLEFRVWLEKSDLWYWIYSVLTLDGIRLERGKIVDILDGKIVEDAPIEIYNFILGYHEVYKDMRSCSEMNLDADPKLLFRWAEELLGRPVSYRRGSPVIYEWNHIPPIAADSEKEMTSLLRSLAMQYRTDKSLRLMALAHLEVLRLYGYDKDTVTVACLLLAYLLLREGYPLPGLSLSDIEYNQLIDAYVNRGDSEGFVTMLERSVLNRLDSVLQLSRQAAELHDQ